jgi:protease IV
VSPAPLRPRGGVGWKALLAIVLLVLAGLSVLAALARLPFRNVSAGRIAGDHSRFLEEVVLEHTNSDYKIAVIELEGVIADEGDRGGLSMPDYISEEFKAASKDGDVKAVVLKVDSPGGEVLAADQINGTIRKFEDDTGKPVVVSMGSLAASGGYYVSAPCRWIVANELTITGSIGVIMHGYNYRSLMDKVGVQPQVFKSGKFKDMLSGEREPDNQLSPEERKVRAEEDAMVQDLINETFGKFKEVVRTGRQWAASQNAEHNPSDAGKAVVGDWEDYADGRVFSGKKALSLGFVDEVGNFDTAVKRAQKLAGIPRANLIQYRIPFDFGTVLSHLLGKTQTPALKVDLGFDLPKLQAGHLYFMALTDLAR